MVSCFFNQTSAFIIGIIHRIRAEVADKVVADYLRQTPRFVVYICRKYMFIPCARIPLFLLNQPSGFVVGIFIPVGYVIDGVVQDAGQRFAVFVIRVRTGRFLSDFSAAFFRAAHSVAVCVVARDRLRLVI